jgi:mannose-6-phosphate isomerase-like protein (cupin superfamily)
MIARRWRGRAARSEDVEAYIAHFEGTVRPSLERTEGFLGASLERVPGAAGRTEIVVVTRWDSYDAIRDFAGEHIDLAVVEPDARAVLIDVAAEAAAHDPWFNRTLSQVNDAVVRLGVIDGDFHWHRHDDQDEFFLVLDGQLLIDIEGSETITLGPRQACTVPKGVVHRTRAPSRTTILMVEAAGVTPTGD